MRADHGCRRLVLALVSSVALTLLQALERVAAQEEMPPPRIQEMSASPPEPRSFAPAATDKLLSINLPTALQLADVRPLDIAVAAERIRLAAATLEQAQALWLPTVYAGVDYYRHDGQIQDTAGNIFGASKSGFLVGAGPSMVFAVSDALLAPLVERQVVRARDAALQTARNDSLLAVAEAYFNIQQARGELAGAEDAAHRAEDLLNRTRQLAPGLVPELEVYRARAEMSRRRQVALAARERWRLTSADLVRVLRLDASALVQPLEPPNLQVTLVELDRSADDLIPMALTNRPELATQQALVQATLARLRQERLRPLIPSILLRGASTTPAGTLGGGLFGGGVNGSMGNFGARGDFDVQVLWEFQNLGFGNRARVNECRAENQLSVLELFRTEDRIAAEVAQAYAQAQSAAARVGEAESELRDAMNSLDRNIQGLAQTRRAGNVVILLVRPHEVVAAVGALAQAYVDYYGAIADYDRAQFRLYHALGHPAQALAEHPPGYSEPVARP